jgi:HAMP domain-containing protein
MPKPDVKPTTPVDELIARFQLETERAIAGVRSDLTGLYADLATKVAVMQDKVTELNTTVGRQTQQLEDAVHHTRKGVDECNLALKEAAKQAREAADSAAVFAKLKDSQPNFAAQVQALEVRLASVVDSNTHLAERLNGLVKQVEEFEVVADSFEETRGEVQGLDLTVQKLGSAVRANRAI